MPIVRREVISNLGFGPRVLKMVENGQNPASIVEDLMGDPEVKTKLSEVGAKRIMPQDIYKFLSREITSTKALVAETGEANPEAAAMAIQSAKEVIMRTLATLSEWEALGARCVSILGRDLDKFEMDSQANVKDTYFPHTMMETTRKAILTSIEGLRAIRGDAQLQGIVRANTINMSTGVSQEELHDILFAVGTELGYDRAKVLEAYTKALIKRKARRGKPIDTQAFYETPRAKFVEALEESTVFGATPA